MSRNGSGVYVLPATNPVVPGSTIATVWANGTMSDIATALTGSLAADGQTPMTGNLNANSNKITNLVAGTVAGNSVEFAQFSTPTFTGDVTCTSTGYIQIPSGTTAQRPASPAVGEIRYNTTLTQFEGYANSAWGSLGGGATGGGSDQIFNLNGQTVTADYSIPSGKNATSAGPITINTGVTVTIPTGSVWVIV